MSQQPLVKNAADRQQVEKARKTERFARKNEIDDMKFLLAIPQFRRFVWRLLKFCSVFSSIWRPSAEIHHLSGKQDTGHWIMGEVTEADPDAFLLMMKESKEKSDPEPESEKEQKSEETNV